MDDHYPGITRALIEMARCNGGINCTRSEKRALKEMRVWLARQPQEPLPAISIWLGDLSSDDLLTVVDGDIDDQDELLATAPPLTGDLLARYFDEVC